MKFIFSSVLIICMFQNEAYGFRSSSSGTCHTIPRVRSSHYQLNRDYPFITIPTSLLPCASSSDSDNSNNNNNNNQEIGSSFVFVDQQTTTTAKYATLSPPPLPPPEAPNTSSRITITDEVRADANDALSNAGWSMPIDGDLTSNDPFVQAINDSIQKEMGVSLEELLNPAKVVNLERDLYVSRLELAKLTGTAISNNGNMISLKTIDCDGGGGGKEAEQLRQTISKNEIQLVTERRSVFRGWLKNIFLVQAILSFGLSYVMASDPYSLFGQYDWYSYYNMDISISVLGYWWWWLFVIPSLRSRRPRGFEKKALDMSFLLSPAISLIAPVATKDTLMIWYANFIVVAGSYVFSYVINDNDDGQDDGDNDNKKTPEWLKFVYKSLDFGTGRERGAR